MTLFPVGPGDFGELFEDDLEPDPVSGSQARASRDGREFDLDAFEYLEKAGAVIVERYVRVDGFPLDALVEGTNGARFYVDAHGSPDRTPRPQAGMRRQDTMLKFGYKALYLAGQGLVPRLLLVTSHMPAPTDSAGRILRDLAKATGPLGRCSGDRRLRGLSTACPLLQGCPGARKASLGAVATKGRAAVH